MALNKTDVPTPGFYEETLPLEGTETYICRVCGESYISYKHRNACDVVAKIKKWAAEGALMDHCSSGSVPPIGTSHL